MLTYITFLRGVNMTGHNSLKMNDLSAMYKDLGFTDAVTYIQSGNVIFSKTGDLTAAETAIKIENKILERFNFTIPVLIRTIEEIRNILSVNPFLDDENYDPSKVAVIFLYQEPNDEQIQKVKKVDYPPDKFKISGKEIFIYCPIGFGRTKLYTNFFEKKMGVTGTARNMKTITTMLNLAEKMQQQINR